AIAPPQEPGVAGFAHRRKGSPPPTDPETDPGCGYGRRNSSALRSPSASVPVPIGIASGLPAKASIVYAPGATGPSVKDPLSSLGAKARRAAAEPPTHRTDPRATGTPFGSIRRPVR